MKHRANFVVFFGIQVVCLSVIVIALVNLLPFAWEVILSCIQDVKEALK